MVSLEEQVWFWGKVEKEDANRALEHCLDGTFVVRESTTPPDKTLHVVHRGVTKHIKILVRPGEGVGLSEDRLIFDNVVAVIQYYSNVTLATHNAHLNVRLTNPLRKKDEADFTGILSNSDDSTWHTYINVFLQSEIRAKKMEGVQEALVAKVEEAQRLSYEITAENQARDLREEQLAHLNMALSHFAAEYHDRVRNNFAEQRDRIQTAEARLEEIQQDMARSQGELRSLSINRDRMKAEKEAIYRQMDWLERLLNMEGWEPQNIQRCLRPFNQDLGARVTIQGIKDMWFVGYMEIKEAREMLRGRDNGTFLVRLNEREEFILSLVNQGKDSHIKIRESNHTFYLKPSCRFASVEELVAHFQQNTLAQQHSKFTVHLQYAVNDPDGI